MSSVSSIRLLLRGPNLFPGCFRRYFPFPSRLHLIVSFFKGEDVLFFRLERDSTEGSHFSRSLRKLGVSCQISTPITESIVLELTRSNDIALLSTTPTCRQ